MLQRADLSLKLVDLFGLSEDDLVKFRDLTLQVREQQFQVR